MKRLVLIVAALACVAGLQANPAGAGVEASCPVLTNTGNELYSCYLYNVALLRVPSDAEVGFWAAQVSARGNFAVARDILLSDESLTTAVDDAYGRMLDRDPDPGGAAFFLAMAKSAGKIEPVQVALGASDESFTLAGGLSDWVEILYLIFLDRDFDEAGRQFWIDQVQSAAMTRADVVAEFQRSLENTEDRIAFSYFRFFDRSSSDAEEAFWRPFLLQHGEFVLRAALASSEEGIDRGTSWPPP